MRRESVSFYCQIRCGEEDFSISEWNNTFQYCIDAGLTEEQMDEILHGKPCKEQCFDCMAIVGDRRIKTKELLKTKKIGA